MAEEHDWQAHLSEVAKILASHGYHAAAREVRDATAEIIRLRSGIWDMLDGGYRHDAVLKKMVIRHIGLMAKGGARLSLRRFGLMAAQATGRQ